MKKPWAYALVVPLSAIFLIGCEPSDELGSKREWSELQAIEYQRRDQSSPAESPTLVHRDGYDILGVRSEGSTDWTWVLLNPSYKPKVKERPQGRAWTLSQSDYDRIISSADVAEPVHRFLESRVKK